MIMGSTAPLEAVVNIVIVFEVKDLYPFELHPARRPFLPQKRVVFGLFGRLALEGRALFRVFADVAPHFALAEEYDQVIEPNCYPIGLKVNCEQFHPFDWHESLIVLPMRDDQPFFWGFLACEYRGVIPIQQNIALDASMVNL
jgi:hypothetical protein